MPVSSRAHDIHDHLPLSSLSPSLFSLNTCTNTILVFPFHIRNDRAVPQSLCRSAKQVGARLRARDVQAREERADLRGVRRRRGGEEVRERELEVGAGEGGG